MTYQRRIYRCAECGCSQDCYGTLKFCEATLRGQQWMKSGNQWYCTRHRQFSKNDKAPMFAALWELHAPDMPAPLPRYLFNLPHKHEFDFAFPEFRLACEIDGGAWVKFGGRHMTDGDRDKLNIAAVKGWRVIRLSPQQLENDPLRHIEVVKLALAWDGVHLINEVMA